jgi:Ca-activated chloride channel family protein
VRERHRFGFLVITLASLLALAACQGSASGAPSAAATESASAEPSSTESSGSGGPANLEAPDEVEAGAQFEVEWTGPDGDGDYVTIVAAGADEWTNEPYFYTLNGSPGRLVAPTADGSYELWYVTGDEEDVLFRRDIEVTPFSGDLLADEEVPAGTEFEVAWNGPDGPGDYVTIVAAGAERWTNEPYFYTSVGSPGMLYAPMEGGAYEIWYVADDGTTFATRDITVLPLDITLDAPDSVARGADFEVEWTGPDGSGDYITIVPMGSADGAYLDYFYTYTGNPGTLTAPDTAGPFEIWYASDRVDGTFARIPITVN